MVLAGETLFLADPLDAMPADDPHAALDGRLGARLWAVSAANGTKLAAQSGVSGRRRRGLGVGSHAPGGGRPGTGGK
jgi:hypothetical protein